MAGVEDFFEGLTILRHSWRRLFVALTICRHGWRRRLFKGLIKLSLLFFISLMCSLIPKDLHSELI